nr:citrate lyase acyl carrier protein [uncultured Dethiosulfovibrio sp.]
MDVVKTAVAGSMESNDAMVTVEPGVGVSVTMESVVMAQFGRAIEDSVLSVLRDMGVSDCSVTVRDRGALDCTIRARVEAAVLRGSRSTS